MLGDKVLEGNDPDMGRTPGAIDTEIQTVMANPDYWDANSPNRAGLVKKVSDLMIEKHKGG